MAKSPPDGHTLLFVATSYGTTPAFPAVPTMKEAGLPSLEIYTWYGTFAPAGTPATAVTRINADINALLGQPDVRKLLAGQGLVPAGGPPGRLGDLVKSEVPRWKRVVQAAKIKAD